MAQKIIPNLWFTDDAEDAFAHYARVFPDARRLSEMRYTEAGPGRPGSIVTLEFEMCGLRFTALNGGPHEPYTDALSLAVECEDQAEIDRIWTGLLEGGGREMRCGWLKDRFGVSWQVVPRHLPALLTDPAAADRVMRAMYAMRKIDLAALEAAARGEAA